MRHRQCIEALKVMLAMRSGVKKATGIPSLLHNELDVRNYHACLFYRALIALTVCMQNQNCHTQLTALAMLTCSSVIPCKSIISCLTPQDEGILWGCPLIMLSRWWTDDTPRKLELELLLGTLKRF